MGSVRPADQPRLRALVLAAGLGTRLRPLTELLPKPLLPVLGIPVVERTLTELVAVGCEAVALNLHHLGSAIQERLGDRFSTTEGTLPIVYSWEEELLGTLGALAPLAAFFAEADEVLIVNGDSTCQWPLSRLLRRHRSRQALATFLLARRADPAAFGGGVGVGRRGRLVSFRPAGPEVEPASRRAVFAGAHVLASELLSGIEARPSDLVRELYEPLLRAGEPLATLTTSRRWHDLGTPGRYRRALVDRVKRGSWVSPQARVDPTAILRHSVIEAGAIVEAGAVVERSVVLPGAHLGRQGRVKKSLISFDTALPEGAGVERQLVWTPRDGVTTHGEDTLLSGLAYRSLN